MSYTRYKFNRNTLAHVTSEGFTKLREVMKLHGADAVALTGSSGVCLMGLLIQAGIPVVHVRKPGEDSHGSNVEFSHGQVSGQRVVFLDDFIDSGNTVRRVADMLDDYSSAQLVAMVALRGIDAQGYQWVQSAFQLRMRRGQIVIPVYERQYDQRF